MTAARPKNVIEASLTTIKLMAHIPFPNRHDIICRERFPLQPLPVTPRSKTPEISVSRLPSRGDSRGLIHAV